MLTICTQISLRWPNYPINFVYQAKHSSLLPTDAAPVSLETNLLIGLFLSQVAFILAVIFNIGGGRTITSEESPWDTTDEELKKLILNEKNEESAEQNDALSVFRLTDEPLSEGPETLSHDVKGESTNEAVEASVHLTTPPKQSATRRKRSVGTPEPSCFSGIYRVEEVAKGIMAKIPVCRDVASARDKCLGATFKTYGKRACEPYYEKVNIGGGIFKIPTKCMCKV